MKRIACLLLSVLMALSLAACGGEAGKAKLTVGSSEQYTEDEILDAMDSVMDFFEKEFDGCELLTLTYDEAYSMKRADGWTAQYKAEQAIVLISSFYVHPNGGNGSLESDEIYENWQWILTRSGSDDWTLQTWGYG